MRINLLFMLITVFGSVGAYFVATTVFGITEFEGIITGIIVSFAISYILLLRFKKE